MRILWKPISTAKPSAIPPGIRRLLLNSGSLTDQLEQCCPQQFNLQLLGKSWQRPLADECRALSLVQGRHALVREIYLQCADTPLVYGRSIIPPRTFSGRERRLAFWGQRSLGDYLFRQPGVIRGQIEIARIPAVSTLGKLARNHIPIDSPLWARRSIFYIQNKPILVVEVFLPGISQCIKNG